MVEFHFRFIRALCTKESELCDWLYLMTRIVSLILALTKIGVGVGFQNTCSGYPTIPLYLYVSGSIDLTLIILSGILYWYFFKKLKIESLTPLQIYIPIYLLWLGLNIWGSYIVFSKYLFFV